MTTLACGHDSNGSQRRVCLHLLGIIDQDYHQRFTGAGLDFDLVCEPCAKNPGLIDVNLRDICLDCFQKIKLEGCWDGIVGNPEILSRTTNLHFRHTIVPLSAPLSGHIVDIRPLHCESGCVWIVLMADARVFRLDLDKGTQQLIATLPESKVDLSASLAIPFSELEELRGSRSIVARRDRKPIAMYLSECGQAVAIVQTHGQHGVVVELATGRKTMDLDRERYHEDVSEFSVAFLRQKDRLLIVHATAWNRLDVSDAMSGELITPRTLAPIRESKVRPQHYLDYFHASLVMSPDGDFIADNGWVWSPFGVILAWNVGRWLNENVWESEDGPTKKSLCQRAYHWDGPLSWVSDRELAAFGYGEDDEWLIPAACIYDVVSGKLIRWFAGPDGKFYFDSHLFSCHKDAGTSVWDVVTGERIAHDPFCPQRYHARAKTFLTVRRDNEFSVSRLEGTDI